MVLSNSSFIFGNLKNVLKISNVELFLSGFFFVVQIKFHSLYYIIVRNVAKANFCSLSLNSQTRITTVRNFSILLVVSFFCHPLKFSTLLHRFFYLLADLYTPQIHKTFPETFITERSSSSRYYYYYDYKSNYYYKDNWTRTF